MTRSLLLALLLTLPLAACGDAEAPAPDREDAPGADEAGSDPGDAGNDRAEAPTGEESAASGGGDGAVAAGDGAVAAGDGSAEPARNPALLDPSLANEQAPDKYTVKLQTTQGDLLIDVTRSWAPNGADRFYNLVRIGYYDDVAFFRVIPGFMAQVGISGDPELNKVWQQARIDDDKVTQSNTAGMVTFATAGPNTRTTQVFLNLDANANLDGMGFAPFGKLRDMEVLKKLYGGYGEGAPRGRGPHQGRLQSQGNAYLKAEFPQLDYIVKATIEP